MKLFHTVLLGLVSGVAVFLMANPGIGETGTASYYDAKKYEGRPTASGEPFRAAKHTAASWTWYGYDVRVTNRRTGESVVVRVNDRGPAKRLVREGRIIDLSPAAFRTISPEGLRPGLIDVKVEPVSRWK